MSKKQWLVLLCLFIMYLLAGAAIFFYVESKEEVKRSLEEVEEKKRLEGLLREHFQGNYSTRRDLFNSLTDYCGKPLGTNMSEEPFVYKWDFYHSLFFVITVVSTIGYGNLAPTTMFTRIFMIFYGLIGIPMNGIVVFTLGEFFGKSFTKLHQRWKKSKLDYDTAKLGLVGQVILYLVPGFTFFIFLPSTIMSVFEGWEYDVSVYYSFVSLTTIGFGDYVAGVTDVFDFGPLYSVYKVFLLIWIIGGMGYVAMILTFISNGMRSKRIKQIEHMLSDNIKNTPKKIRHELRTLLHELLFLRVKPVYKGEFEYVPHMIERSQSCPDLELYKTYSPRMTRKRAMSECYRYVTLQKVQSDSDLNRIDKERTFRPTDDLFEQTDLLFKVVNALSCESLHNNDEIEGGVHGFSDKNILASEYFEPNITQIKPAKRRAISDIRPPSKLLRDAMNGNTWYGGDAKDAINEYNKRYRAKSVYDIARPAKETIFTKIRNRLLSRDESSQDTEKLKFPNEMERARSETPPNILQRRESVLSTSQGQERILEQTSIADFIRALSAVTAPDVESEPLSQNTSPRGRRHGIAPNMLSRRSSFIPEIPRTDFPNNQARRFSLRPSDENLLKDTSNKLRDRMRKISVTFKDERRNSLILEASSSIPPTVQEHVPFSPSESSTSSRVKTLSGSSGVSEGSGPPPYTLYASPQRRFSLKPSNLTQSSSGSPVQKQLQKRDRTESGSSR